VDPDFPRMPALARSAEVWRYNLLDLEYALAPQGGLRQWIKFNLSLFLLVAVPLAGIIGLLFLFDRAFGGLASITDKLFVIVKNILYIGLMGAALLALGTIVFLALRYGRRRLPPGHNFSKNKSN
jgi:hypothetical protein